MVKENSKMIGILKAISEMMDTSTGSTILQTGEQTDMKAYQDSSPMGDKLNAAIISNKFTGPDKTEGKIDQSVAPPNPEVAYLYVNTPLVRITKTRI
jgi:hypothetical protein